MPRTASRMLALPTRTQDFALSDRWTANWCETRPKNFLQKSYLHPSEGGAQDHRRGKLVRRLPLELHLALFRQG
jgi:hypothetical protein